MNVGRTREKQSEVDSRWLCEGYVLLKLGKKLRLWNYLRSSSNVGHNPCSLSYQGILQRSYRLIVPSGPSAVCSRMGITSHWIMFSSKYSRNDFFRIMLSHLCQPWAVYLKNSCLNTHASLRWFHFLPEKNNFCLLITRVFWFWKWYMIFEANWEKCWNKT